MATNSAIATGVDVDGANLRGVTRTRLFVAATIVIDGQIDPVRVRNMSPCGALIEGAVLPSAGSTVELVRAHLRVSGKSIWTSGNQCGLAFAETVDVAEWMTRCNPTQQQRIDAVFHQARCSAANAAGAASKSAIVDGLGLIDTVGDAVEILAAIESALVLDPHVQMHHPGQLRSLQKAMRLLKPLRLPPTSLS